METSVSQAEFSDETRYSEKLFRLASYTLVMLMMACAALTLSALIHHFFPEWNSALMGSLGFFIAFERLITHPRFKKLHAFTFEWLINLAAQWVSMLLVIRITVGLSHGLNAFLAELAFLSRSFVGYFASPEFLIALIICVIVWSLTGYFAEMLDEMGLDQARIALEVRAMDPRYIPPRARLLSLIFTLGTILIFFTALVRVNVRDIFQAATGRFSIELSALSGGGTSTLIYFMLGLALLSQTQFIALHTSWRLEGIRVSRGLARRWGPYSLVFLTILAATVSLLPTHYGLGVLTSLGYVMDVLVRILFFASQLIVSLLVFLLGLPFMLFGGDLPEMTLPPPPALPEPPLAEAFASAAFPWWALIRSILSWLLLAGIVGFSLIHFLRQHREFAQALGKIPGGRWLARIWLRLRALFGVAQNRVAQAVAAGRARLRAWRARGGITSPGGFLSLRRLDPRQRVYYFYLALIRRGGERGLTRTPAQTPYEYASTLEMALPSVDKDIESLTGSFVEARYSRQAIPPEKASLVRATWARIRQALRRVKKP